MVTNEEENIGLDRKIPRKDLYFQKKTQIIDDVT